MSNFLLSSCHILADSGGLAIFIVLAIIFGFAKLFAFFKEKVEDHSTSADDDPPEDMGDLIKRILNQSKEKTEEPTRTAPPTIKRPPVQQQVPTVNVPLPTQSAEYKYQEPQKPAEPVWTPAPRQAEATPKFEPAPRSQPTSPTPPLPFTPLGSEDISANVERMAMDVESAAQAAMDQALSSARTGYQKTLAELEKSNKEVREKASMTNIDFSSPSSIRNAVVMKEILDTPKGLQ